MGGCLGVALLLLLHLLVHSHPLSVRVHHHGFHLTWLLLLLLLVVRLYLLFARGHHVELGDDLESLLDIQGEGLQSRVDDRLSLVEALLLRDGFQVFD